MDKRTYEELHALAMKYDAMDDPLAAEIVADLTTVLEESPTIAVQEDLLPGGKGDNRPDSDFDAKQLAIGIKVEMEHTNDPAKAKEIAKDHLTENKDYYRKLTKAGLVDE